MHVYALYKHVTFLVSIFGSNVSLNIVEYICMYERVVVSAVDLTILSHQEVSCIFK